MKIVKNIVKYIIFIKKDGVAVKGISFYFGYNTNYKERANLIKKAGFECVMTTADPRYNKQNGTIRKQVKVLEKAGLKLSSLHMTYLGSELPNFFLDNKIGNKLEKRIIKDLHIAKKYGFTCVVVHIEGEESSIGYNRIERILEVCKKVDVPIAVENLDTNQSLFVSIFEKYGNNPYLKFCYDCGHNHCFDPEFDYLSKYGDKLICLHLHDNKGDKDSHTLNKYGNIDWDALAVKLSKCNSVNLDYELLMYKKSDEKQEEILSECFNQAVYLENKIQNMEKVKNR